MGPGPLSQPRSHRHGRRVSNGEDAFPRRPQGDQDFGGSAAFTGAVVLEWVFIPCTSVFESAAGVLVSGFAVEFVVVFTSGFVVVAVVAVLPVTGAGAGGGGGIAVGLAGFGGAGPCLAEELVGRVARGQAASRLGERG